MPFIAWGPSLPPRRIDTRVSLIDVGPTVLHMFRIAAPDSYMGRSLWPLMRGYTSTVPRPIFAEGRLRQAMYTSDGLKVIEDTLRRTTEVYDVESDPGELVNLFDTERTRVEPAVAELRAFFTQRTLIADGYKPPFKP